MVKCSGVRFEIFQHLFLVHRLQNSIALDTAAEGFYDIEQIKPANHFPRLKRRLVGADTISPFHCFAHEQPPVSGEDHPVIFNHGLNEPFFVSTVVKSDIEPQEAHFSDQLSEVAVGDKPQSTQWSCLEPRGIRNIKLLED